MIITGKFYQSATQTDTQSAASQTSSAGTSSVDSTQALKSFFQDDTESKGFSDTVQISAKALSVLQNYVNSDSGSSAAATIASSDDPLLSYISQRAKQAYMTGGQANPAEGTLSEMSDYIDAYSNRNVSDIFQQVKDANQQMSDEFIANASRYGVQNLL